jgi:hypothetical protein
MDEEGCKWVWPGTGWTRQPGDVFTCPVGQECPEPTRTGNFIGDTETTHCEIEG